MSLNYQLSAELQLILDATRLGVKHKNTSTTDRKWQQIDWPRALKLARFHGLSCWLAEYIKEQAKVAPEAVPPEVIKKLTQQQRKQLVSYLYTEQQKCELITTLQDSGIRFALLKGVAIAKPLYKERWYYRTVADVDILIDPEQLEQAFDKLKAIGYADVSKTPLTEPTFKHIAKYHKKLNDIEHSLQFPNRKLTLDVHWKIRREFLFPISYQGLFNSLVQDSAAGFRLAQPLEFIHLCVNGMNDGWRKLKAVVDIYYYAENITDWSPIKETAEQLGLSHIVNASLAVCDFFYGTCYGPEQLNSKEKTLFTFIINGFDRDNEIPCEHSYLDKRNAYVFIKTSLSWWLALSSELFSTIKVIKSLLIPNKTDLAPGQLPRTDHFTFSVFIRIKRMLKKYLYAKG